MHIKTILNLVQRHPMFVYGKATLVKGSTPALHVVIRPRKGAKPRCSGCGRACPGYDRLPERSYRYLPLFATIAVFFVYRPRRCDCSRCGVTVEVVPWAKGKSPITTSFAWYLASWAKDLSWQRVARRFDVSWGVVFKSVKMAVRWGPEHRSLDGIQAIGVDEIARRKGQADFTMVYQIDNGCRRLLWIGRDRTAASFRRFFDLLGDRSRSIEFVASDMWKAYLGVIRERAPWVVHVLDRFHVVELTTEAVDETRREEVRALRAEGKEPVLKDSRWLFLKNEVNLTARQAPLLKTLLKRNLRTVKAYLLKEMLHGFWAKKTRKAGMNFLTNWCHSATQSRLPAFGRVAATLTQHQQLLLNWFRAKDAFAKGAAEGLNNKARVITRRSYGFRTTKVAQVALFHALGELPEPDWVTHRFG